MLGLGRRLRIGLWTLLGVSAIATVYLGWHYVVDDLAGLVMGLTALALARLLTGFEPPIPRPRPVLAVTAAAAALKRRVSQAPP
jgi:membrane-associated phospholipid phosphatase